MEEFVSQVRDTAAGVRRSSTAVPATVDPRRIRSANAALIKAFIKDFEFALHVPGSYPNGVLFEDVIGWLAEGRRDFLADSATLRRRVQAKLSNLFEHQPRVVTIDELKRGASYEIKATVAARFENLLRDVRIRADLQTTILRKMRSGLDSRTGIATGALLAAIRSDACTVTITV